MYSLAVGSVTTAQRAKEILRKNGINAHIQRYSGERRIGCGYSLLVSADTDRCVRLLNSFGIKVLDVIKR